MNSELDKKCQLLADNYKICRKSAKLDFNQAASLGALLFTYADRNADEKEIRNNRKLLKSKVSIFNSMRGYTQLALIVKMCLEEDPEKFIDNVLAAYGALKAEKTLYRTEYTAAAAQIIAAQADPADYSKVAKDTYDILAKMRKQHPFLTTTADTTMACLFAMSDIDYDSLLTEAANCYEYLKGSGFKLNKDTLQVASFILAMSPKSVEQKCEKFKEIRQALKEAKHPIRWEELAIIAALCDVDIPINKLVDEIVQADERLKHERGFGIFGAGRQLRRLYVSALVLQVHADELIDEIASNNVMHATHAMVQIIVLAIILSIVTAAVIASSSHSSSSSQG